MNSCLVSYAWITSLSQNLPQTMYLALLYIEHFLHFILKKSLEVSGCFGLGWLTPSPAARGPLPLTPEYLSPLYRLHSLFLGFSVLCFLGLNPCFGDLLLQQPPEKETEEIFACLSLPSVLIPD